MLSCRLVLSALLAASLPSGASAQRVAFHDGTEVSGAIVGIDGESIRILEGKTDTGEATGSGQGNPEAKSIALYEIGAIHFGSGEPEDAHRAMEDVPGPVLCFRSGQVLAGDVTGTYTSAHAGSTERVDVARIEVSGAGALDVPLELLWGFRLQRPHERDELFRDDLAAAIRDAADGARSGAEPQDWIYVVRDRQLLKVGGVFRSLDGDSLSLEYKGKTRRIPRSKVFGAILAPAAARRVESGYPAVFRLTSGDEFPAVLVGMRQEPSGARELLLRFRGSDPDSRQSVPIDRVREVRFFSDRVAFLSDLAPVRARENPLVGSRTGFPWQRDRSTTGEALELAGRAYRKGLGVHSYSSLEFDIAGRYSTFAATVGLVDREPEAGAREPAVAGVTFRAYADDKVIFEKDVLSGEKPRKVLLPVIGVERLRLEVDYGKDGVDFGDHAAWAEARVIKE